MMAENRRFDITKNKDFFNPKSNKKTHIKSKLIVVRRKIVETERPVIYIGMALIMLKMRPPKRVL